MLPLCCGCCTYRFATLANPHPRLSSFVIVRRRLIGLGPSQRLAQRQGTATQRNDRATTTRHINSDGGCGAELERFHTRRRCTGDADYYIGGPRSTTTCGNERHPSSVPWLGGFDVDSEGEGRLVGGPIHPIQYSDHRAQGRNHVGCWDGGIRDLGTPKAREPIPRGRSTSRLGATLGGTYVAQLSVVGGRLYSRFSVRWKTMPLWSFSAAAMARWRCASRIHSSGRFKYRS